MSRKGQQLLRQFSFFCVGATFSLFTLSAQAAGQLDWLGYTDVSPRGFVVAARIDEPVQVVTVRVYLDSERTVEVTSNLIITSDAAALSYLANGIIRVPVKGALLNTEYFTQLEIQTNSATYYLPDLSASLSGVSTANAPTAPATAGVLRLNDLAAIDLSNASFDAHSLVKLQTASMASTLSLLSVESKAYFDMNNAIDSQGDRVLLAQGERVVVEQYPGLDCYQSQAIVRFREVAPPTAIGAPLSFSSLDVCFFADQNCDSQVSSLDVDILITNMLSSQTDCGFNPDADVVIDAQVNVLDFQAVLNRYGETGPFE